MKKIYRNYIVLSVMLILIALIISNCGGGDDTGAMPNVSGNPGITQNLVSKDVSGFVYATSSLSASKDGEDEETLFSILDIPLTGEDGFIAQVNEYIQGDSSSKGSSPETEELLTAFTEETGQYQPLPVWNSAANIYSSYADSLSTSPVPISPEGEISSSVLVDAADDLISLDIEVSGEECYETEAISSTDLLNSSETSGEYVLKSCPKKIIIKPGDCEVFQVFSKPSVNLFDAGLQFSLVNPELGTVCGPIFLRCNGAKKYSVAYGVIYAKKNVSTPVDTAINVSTTQGQSLILPVQIVKKTAIVSGKVYASGPIVKGYVISQGPKSQCKINADGIYSLPKVWQGTGRKITATWWVMNGNKKVRYRETKYVDVLGDVTVDFGVVPTPTPFPPFTDQYYNYISVKILEQKTEWEQQIGKELGTQKTADWLNNLVPGNPPPSDIIEAIKDAEVDEYEPCRLKMRFKSGFQVWLNSNNDYLEEDSSISNRNISSSVENTDFTPKSIVASIQQTVKNGDTLMLGASSVEDTDYNDLMFNTIRQSFESKYGTEHVKCLHSGRENLDYAYYTPSEPPSLWNRYVFWTIKDGKQDNVPRPDDFLDMDRFGVIYIFGHGSRNGITACPYYYDDVKLGTWITTTDPNYYVVEWHSIYLSKYIEAQYQSIFLLEDFFDAFDNNPDFSGSLVYVNACESVQFYDGRASKLAPPYRFASGAKVFLGFVNPSEMCPQRFSYPFFKYMLDNEMSAGKAYRDVMLDPEYWTWLNKYEFTLQALNSNIYLPVGANATVD